MKSKDFNSNLDLLETEVAIYFNELLAQKKEFIIFSEEDLEHDTQIKHKTCLTSSTMNILNFYYHLKKINHESI